jgi:hypothetical protein
VGPTFRTTATSSRRRKLPGRTAFRTHESCDSPARCTFFRWACHKLCLTVKSDESIGQSLGLEGDQHLQLRRLKTSLESTTVCGQPRFSDAVCKADPVLHGTRYAWPYGHTIAGVTTRDGRRANPTEQDPGRSTVSYRPSAREDSVILNSAGIHVAVPRGKPTCWHSVADARPYGREPTCHAWVIGVGCPAPFTTPATARALSHLTATTC